MIRTMAQDASINAKSSGRLSDPQAPPPHNDSLEVELTAETKPGSAVKGYIAPANVREFRTFPSLWSELIGVITVQVFSSVQVVG